MGIVLGLVAAVFWGTADFFARGATRAIGTYRTLMYIQFIGFIGLSAYLALSGEFARLAETTTWQHWAWGMLVGVLNMVSSLMLYRSFEVCYAMAVVSPIAASYAAITVVLSVLSGEHLSATRGIGIGLAMIGVMLAAADLRSLARGQRPPGGLLGGGVGWALGASVAYGVTFWLLGFQVTPYLGGVAPVWVVRMVTITVLMSAGLLIGQNVRPPTLPVWRTIFLIGVLDTTAFVANSLGLLSEQVSVVTVMAGLFSAFTVLLSWWLLKERLAANQWAGIALIFGGIVLVSI